jgi:hypothetical protein
MKIRYSPQGRNDLQEIFISMSEVHLGLQM